MLDAGCWVRADVVSSLRAFFSEAISRLVGWRLLRQEGLAGTEFF